MSVHGEVRPENTLVADRQLCAKAAVPGVARKSADRRHYQPCHAVQVGEPGLTEASPTNRAAWPSF